MEKHWEVETEWPSLMEPLEPPNLVSSIETEWPSTAMEIGTSCMVEEGF